MMWKSVSLALGHGPRICLGQPVADHEDARGDELWKTGRGVEGKDILCCFAKRDVTIMLKIR